MVQSIPGTWSVTAQGTLLLLMSGPVCLRSPGLLQESFTACPGFAASAILSLWPFWKGQCGKAELVHVELWVQGPSCSYTFSSVALLLL